MKRLVIALVALSACQPSPTEAPGEVPTGEASVPALAVSASGEALTSSVVADGETRRLVVTHPDGTTVEVARGAVSDFSQSAPRLVAAPGGVVLVLYAVDVAAQSGHAPTSNLFVTRSADGGRSFAAPTRVNPDGRTPAESAFADVAVGPGGEVVVSWLAEASPDAGGHDHAETSASSDPHALPIRLVQEGEEHGEAQQDDEPGSTLVVSRSRDGGAPFEAPVAVAENACPCCRTALDVGPDGAVRVAWRRVWDGGERDPAIATSTDGGRTFGAPVRVHADRWAIEGCPTAGPAVAAGADGRVHVAWYTGADGQMGLWHAVSSDGGKTFADPTPLAAGAPLGQTRAARDGQGRVWLAWEDRATARTRLAPAAGGDTLTTAGVDPALVGTAAGWALATVDGGSVRTRTRTN